MEINYFIIAFCKCQLNNNLVSNVYVGTDGKIHVVKGGADTGLNFSKTPKLLASNVSSLNAYSYICTSLPNYKELTANNFFVVFKSIGRTALGSSNTGAFTKSYNPSTGTLSIGKYYQYESSDSHIAMYATYDIYLIA